MPVLHEEHDGAGGVFFLVTAMICALITMVVLNLSFVSHAKSVADNCAYITAINSAAYSYIGGYEKYTLKNPILTGPDGDSYDPLAEYTAMLEECGICRTYPAEVTVTWDPGTNLCYVQYGSFENRLGATITPNRQESIITE